MMELHGVHMIFEELSEVFKEQKLLQMEIINLRRFLMPQTCNMSVSMTNVMVTARSRVPSLKLKKN